MGSDTQYSIPVIDFSSINSPETLRGTQGWNYMCKRVREACENYGCFELVYDKIPRQARAEIFSLIREFFELPSETKSKNLNLKPYHGYYDFQTDAISYEGFGVEEDVKSFVDQFCESVTTMMKQMDEVYKAIEMMIIDSYGLEEKMCSIFDYRTLIRAMKYKPGKEIVGLKPHSDKVPSVILCEDQISGLEVQTRDGQNWIKLTPSPNSFVFVVGDPLMAWSNGRMHAVNHKVTVRGDETRYSYGAFQVPVEGSIVKPPNELVNDIDYPRLFKEFDFMDFVNFANSKQGLAMESTKVVHFFAGNY